MDKPTYTTSTDYTNVYRYVHLESGKGPSFDGEQFASYDDIRTTLKRYITGPFALDGRNHTGTASAAVSLGRSGGKARSDAKSSAARANGAKGGRPRKTKPG